MGSFLLLDWNTVVTLCLMNDHLSTSGKGFECEIIFFFFVSVFVASDSTIFLIATEKMSVSLFV